MTKYEEKEMFSDKVKIITCPICGAEINKEVRSGVPEDELDEAIGLHNEEDKRFKRFHNDCEANRQAENDHSHQQQLRIKAEREAKKNG